MNIKEVRDIFEDNYNVTFLKDGIKELHSLYANFQEETIEEALEIVIIQYDDGKEAFRKFGGVCYNLEKEIIRYNEKDK